MDTIKTIDLKEWELVGGGKRGDSYFHRNDPDLMVKFDNTRIPVDVMRIEVENARIVSSLGLPTPAPGELVTDGQRYGITFHRIRGKESFARLSGMYPDRIPELAAEFASVVKLMHSTRGAGSGLRNIKDVYGHFIQTNPFHSAATIAKVMDIMGSVPDGDTCVHGDLHFGNIITAEGRSYLIDLGDFCYGHAFFDFGMMLMVDRMGFLMPEMTSHLYHCTPEQGDMFWNCFLKEYFGTESDRNELEASMMPYLVIRAFTMETETGIRLPEQLQSMVHDYLDSVA